MGATSDRGAEPLADIQLPERYELVRRIATGGMASVWCAEDQRARAPGGDQAAVRARTPTTRRRCSGSSGRPGWPLACPGIRTSSRSSTSAMRPGPIDGQPRLHRHGVPGRRHGRRRASGWARSAARMRCAGSPEAASRSITPTTAAWSTGTSSRPTCCSTAIGRARGRLRDRAASATDETITGTDMVLGTAAYISPEQALGVAATAASDRYALAVAAFELLVGQRPFGAGELAAQARQHVEEPPPQATARNPALPRGVDAVLARGMAKRPEDRWPSAGAFAEAIETRAQPPRGPNPRDGRDAAPAEDPRRGGRGLTAASAARPASARPAGASAARPAAGAAPEPGRSVHGAAGSRWRLWRLPCSGWSWSRSPRHFRAGPRSPARPRRFTGRPPSTAPRPPRTRRRPRSQSRSQRRRRRPRPDHVAPR